MNEEIGYAGQVLGHLMETAGRALPGVLAGLVVILVFLVLAGLSRRLLRPLAARVATERRPLVGLLGEAVRYGIITLGLIMGLGTMGVDVAALIAGLGLVGFALGFALRDAVSNLIAGALILLYQPFALGDRISVAGVVGAVADINFRYTVLEAEGGAVIHVPNGTLFNNNVTVQPQAEDAA